MFEVFNTGVYLHAPRPHLFKLPIDDYPTLPPPTECDSWSLKCPFNIRPSFYQGALDYKVPISFAVGYFTTVALVNQINRRRGYKPYWFSKTKAFWLFTVIHNSSLALYSAVTFAAMVRMVYMFWPGWFGKHGLIGAVDSLCKLHGPRGYGDAVTYNQTTNTWSAKNSLIHLDQSGAYPDDSDVGRIWNEGLAWWGFWFYLSKFYEVLDTVIILSKGKRSSTLQTYHHTGAMFCMWAGIRFMAAPIYMFCLINSFIHTLMYTFYTVTCFGIKVPGHLKRLITTLQILQLITGVFYASAHFFVSYDVPVTNIFKLTSALSSPQAASSAASSLLADATQAAQRAGDFPPWIKRLAYRAAGAEALAESVHDGNIYTDRQAAEKRWHAHNATEAQKKEYEERTHIERVNCLDTNGQGFAVWLNVAYLIPLAALFIRFFVKSYLRKGREDAKKPRKGRGSFNEARRWSESAQEAARATANSVECLGVKGEEAIDESIDVVEETIEDLKKSDIGKDVKAKVDNAKNSDVVKDAKAKAADMQKSASENAEQVKKIASEKAEQVQNTASEKAEQVKNSDAAKAAKAKAADIQQNVSDKVAEAKNSDAAQNLSESTEKLSKKARKAAKQANESANGSNLEDSYVEVKDEVGNKVDEVTGNRSAGDVVEVDNSTEVKATASKSSKQPESEWMKSPTKSSKLPVKSKDKSIGEPKDVLDPKPAINSSHGDFSYAGAVKEDLAPDDHGDQPDLPPKIETLD